MFDELFEMFERDREHARPGERRVRRLGFRFHRGARKGALFFLGAIGRSHYPHGMDLAV